MSNNKEIMKIYTEEQVRSMIMSMGTFSDEQIDYYIDKLTPIELPSDEEIEAEIWVNIEGQWITFADTFRRAAKWMRNKIQGGNK